MVRINTQPYKKKLFQAQRSDHAYYMFFGVAETREWSGG